MSRDTRPNIVMCMCDQLRPFEVGCYGHPVVRTPNIDRLASQGARFEVACSNSPLCIPARNALLSGQHARTCTGTVSNFCGFPPSRQRVVCLDPVLPEVLRDQGYRTALVGKWHLHPAPDLLGFDEADYPHNLHRHHRQSFYDIAGRRTQVDGFSLDYEIERVRDFVDRPDDTSPFFLYYNISPPHSPLMDAPDRYTRMYGRDHVLLRDNVGEAGQHTGDRDWFRMYLWDYLGHLSLHLNHDDVTMPDDYDARRAANPTFGVQKLLQDVRALMDDPVAGTATRKQMPYLDESRLDGFDLRDLTALYYGMVTCVDDYVGKLMAMLEEAGVAENTIVVFLSDHGDNLGSHHLWMKDRLYEESIRIPMVFRWPGQVRTGAIDTQVASIVDVMPTLLGLVGSQPPAHCAGTDLSDVLRGRADAAGDNRAYLEAYRHQAIGVRTLDRFYGIPMRGADETRWQPVADTTCHLAFDLRDDPCQMRNRAGDTAHDAAFAPLRDALLTWHEQTPRRPMPQPTTGATSVAIY